MQELHEFAFEGPEMEERFLGNAQDAEVDDGFEEGEVGADVGNTAFFVLGSSFLVGSGKACWRG